MNARALVVGLAGVALLVWVVWAAFFRLPVIAPRYSSTVEDLAPDACRDCAFVDRVAGESLRIFTPLAALPAAVPAYFVAVEDGNFWTHRGVDWGRLRAAAMRNIAARRYVSGASTITMQLVRTLLLSREQRLGRKAREIAYALALERRWSKTRILETYLNEVDFGRGLRGIGAAACYYLAVPPTELTARDAWYLAAILRSPDRLAPHVARSPCARTS
jgi:membrane peptidoglycan carboxypeptidase